VENVLRGLVPHAEEIGNFPLLDRLFQLFGRRYFQLRRKEVGRLWPDTGNLQERRYAFGEFVLEAFISAELSRLYQFGALLCYRIATPGIF